MIRKSFGQSSTRILQGIFIKTQQKSSFAKRLMREDVFSENCIIMRVMRGLLRNMKSNVSIFTQPIGFNSGKKSVSIEMNGCFLSLDNLPYCNQSQ